MSNKRDRSDRAREDLACSIRDLTKEEILEMLADVEDMDAIHAALDNVCIRPDWHVAEAVVPAILERGVTSTNSLATAVVHSSWNVVEMLLDFFLKTQPTLLLTAVPEGMDTLSFLLWACFLRQDGEGVHIARRLLERGANIETRYRGMTPLLHASTRGFHGMVRMLLQKGADVRATFDEEKHNALHAVINNHRHPALIPVLLAAGVPTDSSMFLACVDNHYPGWICAEVLRNTSAEDWHIAFEAMADCQDDATWLHVSLIIGGMRHPCTGETLLHVACRSNNKSALRILTTKMRTINPFWRDHEDDKMAIELTTDPEMKAMLNDYSIFEPTLTCVAWFGPTFLEEAQAFAKACTAAREAGVMGIIPRDIERKILQYLAKSYTVAN